MRDLRFNQLREERKMKTVSAVLGLLLALVVGGTAANAQCYVGAAVGASMANTEVTSPLLPGFGLNGLGSQSERPSIGVRGGCDWKMIGSPFVIGAFADYTNQKVTFSVDPNLLSASLGDSFMAGVRLGYDMQGAMPYVVLAGRQTDLSFGSGVINLAGVPLPDSVKGLTVGGGIEAPIKGTNWSLAGEVLYTRYESERVLNIIDLKTDQLEGSLRLSYRFMGGPAAQAPLK